MGITQTQELTRWANRIAQEVEPESEPLAPLILEAYLRGGNERKQLFKTVPALGGFLPDGGVSLLPFAYLAISTVATGLMKLQNAGGLHVLNDLLTAWKNCLEIIKSQKKAPEKTPPAKPSEPLFVLRHILGEVQQALKNQGLPEDRCELVSYQVIKVLLQEPVEAAQLIRTFHT